MRDLKHLVGSKIDYGNRMLSLDLVPRDENGVPITPKTVGVMQLYKLVSKVALPLMYCFISGADINYVGRQKNWTP